MKQILKLQFVLYAVCLNVISTTSSAEPQHRLTVGEFLRKSNYAKVYNRKRESRLLVVSAFPPEIPSKKPPLPPSRSPKSSQESSNVDQEEFPNVYPPPKKYYKTFYDNMNNYSENISCAQIGKTCGPNTIAQAANKAYKQHTGGRVKSEDIGRAAVPTLAQNANEYATQHGLKLTFTPITEATPEKMRKLLEEQKLPIYASIRKDLKRPPHAISIYRYDPVTEKILYYDTRNSRDPQTNKYTGYGSYKSMKLKDFLNIWQGRIIEITPNY